MRLRFAPSPTGNLHLGGLRTALFNYLVARKFNGSFIVRVEDTDRKRYVRNALDNLLYCLKWSGISYDEGPDIGGEFGPYFQSQRLDIYNKAVDQLLQSGNAYRDYASPGDPTLILTGKDENLHKPHVIRLKMPMSDTIYDDIVYGKMAIPSPKPAHLGHTNDPIILKSDKFPTYHLANVVDDHHMKISHVLRGEEWLSSMPKHLAIYKALQIPPPSFAHLPLLINNDGSKLSKRSGDVSVQDYIDKQWEPEALINFIALLGWNSLKSSDNPESTSDFLTMFDLISRFDLNDIPHKRAAMFIGKLYYLNKLHLVFKINNKDKDVLHRFKKLVGEQLKINEGNYGDDYYQSVLMLIKDRINNLNDAPSIGDYFFIEPDYNSVESHTAFNIINKDKFSPAIILTKVYDSLVSQDDVFKSLQNLNQLLKVQQSNLGLKTNEFMMPLRWALTGKKMGPSIASTIHLLDKQTTLYRLRICIDNIN